MNLKRVLSVILLIYLLIAGGGGRYAAAQTAATSTDVQNQIQDRTAKLNAINQQIQETQTTLNQVQQQKSSLQRELKTLDTSIQNLNLNIQADSLQAQNLGDQVKGLQYDVEAMAQSITDKQNTVVELLRQLQKADGQNTILTLLGDGNLTDFLRDSVSLENLRSELSIEIVQLNDLSAQYKQKIGQVNDAKAQVAIHVENLQNRKIIVADQQLERQAVLTVTQDQEAAYQQKLAALTAQQNALEDEITQMENDLLKNFNMSVVPVKRHGVLAWPLANIIITQHYGERSALYRGHPHNGLDLGAPIGTPVMAAADGVVMAVDDNDQSAWRRYQYGKYVLIKHPDNLATLYGHLSRQVVYPGEVVKKGDIIGYSGKTGYATGPHLHLGLYWAPSISLKRIPPAAGLVPVGVTLNPEDYLP